jgi:DNA-directed RNA polymerase specialized sigma24 family protein
LGRLFTGSVLISVYGLVILSPLMRSPRYYIVISFILLCFTGTAQNRYEGLLNKTHAQRVQLLLPFYHTVLIQEDSALIFRKIDSVRQVADAHGDDDLQMEVSLMYAHYFYYRKYFNGERTLSIIDSVKKEAVKRKKVWAEALAENMAALHNFQTLQNYELAFEHHQRVYNLIKDLSPHEFPHKQNCLSQMADEYYYFNDFEESIQYNRLALESEPPFALYPPAIRIIILNTVGLSYQKLGRLDSSDYYLNEAHAQAVKENNIAWQGISSGNLGYNAFQRKQFNTAILLLEKDVEIAVQTSDWGLASGSLMVLGDISLQQKNIAKARQQLSEARAYIYRSGQYQRLQYLYPLLSRLYSAEGNGSMASLFLDSALFLKDSIARKLNSLQMLRAKQKVDLEKFRAEMDNIESERKINMLERDILIAVVLLMMGVAVYIYKEQQKKYRLKQEELEKASRQLKDFARNISEKNALIEMLEQQHGDETSEAIQQLRKSTILTDDEWEYFRELFEKVHHGFLHRLKEKMPELTPAETRFVVLSKLGLTGKEMAGMLGIGADAVRQLRSRVRKKLNLHDETGLEEFVTHI